MNKIHWIAQHGAVIWGVRYHPHLACGKPLYSNADIDITMNPAKVTCEVCKKSNTFKEMLNETT